MDIIGTVLAQDSMYTNALASVPVDSKKGPIDKNRILLGVYISNSLMIIYDLLFHLTHVTMFFYRESSVPIESNAYE